MRCMWLMACLLTACLPLAQAAPPIQETVIDAAATREPTAPAPSTAQLPTLPAAPPAASPAPAVIATDETTSLPNSDFLEPAGCQSPPDDYTRVEANDWRLNARTLAMLEYAAELYAGPIDLTGSALTQGSYSSNGPASFGTHLGGGVVDISVIQPGGRSVLYHEIEPLIRALRTAGFAAWLRDWNDLGPGSGIHIHAVAIGDRELSAEAEAQVDSEFGYFYGQNGLAPSRGAVGPDRHGGPIVCAWMKELGYSDQRPAAARAPAPVDWQANLRLAAAHYITDSVEGTRALAFLIDFRPGRNEDPSNMCGPLAGAILRDAGLLPAAPGPAHDLRRYWLAKPTANGRPWSMFPERDYELHQFKTAINRFDFNAWPLYPGDFVYTYQGQDGYEHMLIVTEVDARGRAFTVTNNKHSERVYIAERVLLYDPQDPTAGAFKRDWVSSPIVGRTGLGGFDVLRPRGKNLPPGSRYAYAVRPGDTLVGLAYAYGTTPAAIARENQLDAPYALRLGQALQLPVNSLFASTP